MRREIQIKKLERPWEREVVGILNAFDVDPGQDLSSSEVKISVSGTEGIAYRVKSKKAPGRYFWNKRRYLGTR